MAAPAEFTALPSGMDYMPLKVGAAKLRCPVEKCRAEFECPPVGPAVKCPGCGYERHYLLTGCRDQCGRYATLGEESAVGWYWLEFARCWRCPDCTRQLKEVNRART